MKLLISFDKIKMLLIVGFCVLVTDNSSVLHSQTANPKNTQTRQQTQKPPPAKKPKFPDRYSSLDNPKAVKTITEEMIEIKIENARQSYIRGLIVIDRQDTIEAIRYFETAIVELNKLASYPDMEVNENYIELLNSVVDDYMAITKNRDDVELVITPKYRIFEEEEEEELEEISDSLNIADIDSIEDSNYTKPPSADTSDRYIFTIPHISDLQIPMSENSAIDSQIALLTTGRLRAWPRGWMERSAKWFPLMRTIAEREGMPEELLVLTFIESSLNPLAESKAGAVGLWQFMYPTGLDYNLNKNGSIWVDERRDPVKSTRAAMRYLRDLYLEFGDWYLALNAYNWGWGKVRRALRQCNKANPTYWDIRNQRNINMPREARSYVPLFIAVMRITSEPEKYGIDVNTLNYAPEFRFDVLEIEQATNLSAIAQCLGVGTEEIKELNPELLFDITPPDRKHYPLRIPVGSGKNFASNFAKLSDEIKQPSLEYRIGKNETIVSVAEKFDVSIDELIKLNTFNPKYITLENNRIIKIPIGGKTYSQSNLMLANNELVPKSALLISNNNYHIAQKTESIYEIAEQYKISPASIRNWNDFPIDQDSVEEGRVIVISGFEAEKNRLKKVDNNEVITNPVLSLPEIITYKVVAGDNLSNIAKKYETTESAIRELNPKIKDDKILVGDLLLIPNNSAVRSNSQPQTPTTTVATNNRTTRTNTNTSVQTHTVVAGDNLYRIARKYSTTVDKLISLNRNINPDKLSLGQKIRVR